MVPARMPSVVGAIAGLASVVWVAASLWPGAYVPAWPAATLGLFALALMWLPGPAGTRALGTITACVGTVAAALQIAVLWGVALGLPTG